MRPEGLFLLSPLPRGSWRGSFPREPSTPRRTPLNPPSTRGEEEGLGIPCTARGVRQRLDACDPHGFGGEAFDFEDDVRRRARRATPHRPMPSRARLVGSGTETAEGWNARKSGSSLVNAKTVPVPPP